MEHLTVLKMLHIFWHNRVSSLPNKMKSFGIFSFGTLPVSWCKFHKFDNPFIFAQKIKNILPAATYEDLLQLGNMIGADKKQMFTKKYRTATSKKKAKAKTCCRSAGNGLKIIIFKLV